ncbi:uncharacterized protein LOC119335896 isoform X1 [Triticum dicoccoides]|uniref:uncharacterized protein LOC119335896 isoform X1 n=1 Tax=Triticum dicoccoides TaxID=85692 RepID=UPI001891C974|nr:uncharacterized protein LOC119335896 isoform X1 [Triticum dicoccoides]
MGRRRLDFCSRSALRRRRPSPSLASWSCPFPSPICSPRRRLPPRTIPSRSAATPSLEQPLPPNPKPPAGATPQHAPSLLFLGTGLWPRRILPLSPSSSRSNGLVHKSGSTSRSSLFRSSPSTTMAPPHAHRTRAQVLCKSALGSRYSFSRWAWFWNSHVFSNFDSA